MNDVLPVCEPAYLSLKLPERKGLMEEKKVRCVVVGAKGRMGQMICSSILSSDGFILAGATEHQNSRFIGETVASTPNISVCGSLEEITAPFDVIIDFTFPSVSMQTVQFANQNAKAAVIGTTGFSPQENGAIKTLSSGFPCVCAPNMSIGVNLLFKLAGEVTRLLKDNYDCEIIEMHHRFKKDAPSGTALRLAEIVAEAKQVDPENAFVFERKGMTGERKKEDIGIQTIRAGDIVGEHTLLFGGAGERVELTHKAQSRDCFVQGALYAAKWISAKPNGYYDMQDVIGLK